MTETKRKTWIVDESGAGDYRTLTEAVLYRHARRRSPSAAAG